MEELFKALFHKESDIRAFACFLKVIGNESYITKNTRQIKSFGKFLQDVIQTCNKNEQFRPLLKIMVYEDIIGSYSTHMMDLKDDDFRPKYYISQYFKTESSALQLTNPFVAKRILSGLLKANSFHMFLDRVDDILSMVFTIQHLWKGDYRLKNKFWQLTI